jgi:cell wall-associated NlpC family hydrolase
MTGNRKHKPYSRLALLAILAVMTCFVITHHSLSRKSNVDDTTISGSDIIIVNKTAAGIFATADSSSEMVTQALLAAELTVVKQIAGWYQVKVPDGYLGWIKSEDIAPHYASDKTKTKALIYEPLVNIKTQPEVNAPTITQAPLGSLLPLARETRDWCQIILPGANYGWIPTLSMKKIIGEKIPRGSGQEIIATAHKLLGTPYLWGGMTQKGIDCSGLTYWAYYVNGLQLPRDADLQYNTGEPIFLSNLVPGDLVFFSSNGPPPSHVGMYLGNGQFIHASSNTNGVAISNLKDYLTTYLGARRYIK